MTYTEKYFAMKYWLSIAGYSLLAIILLGIAALFLWSYITDKRDEQRRADYLDKVRRENQSMQDKASFL